MRKGSYSQLELFSQHKLFDKKNARDNNPFLGYIRSHERIVLWVICIIITNSIAFSLGIEKGKRYAALRKIKDYSDIKITQTLKGDDQKTDVTARPELTALTKNENQAGPAAKNEEPPDVDPSIKEKPGITPDNPVKEKPGNYIIRLASYKSKSVAQKEAQELKKTGYKATVSAKGKFFVLTVGKFKTKETADSALSKLKTKYKDSYLRRL